MCVKSIPVIDPTDCPFRYWRQEPDDYMCSVWDCNCSHGGSRRIEELQHEVTPGVMKITYKEAWTFQNCPFGDKPFNINVEQD